MRNLFVILREEHRLWLYESSVLIGIFGHKKYQTSGDQRHLHSEQRHVSAFHLILLG
jgi:hypothetical protein